MTTQADAQVLFTVPESPSAMHSYKATMPHRTRLITYSPPATFCTTFTSSISKLTGMPKQQQLQTCALARVHRETAQGTGRVALSDPERDQPEQKRIMKGKGMV
jgi:hypothetical protein